MSRHRIEPETVCPWTPYIDIGIPRQPIDTRHTFRAGQRQDVRRPYSVQTAVRVVYGRGYQDFDILCQDFDKTTPGDPIIFISSVIHFITRFTNKLNLPTTKHTLKTLSLPI